MLTPRTVLVVDDMRDSRELAVDVLQAAGFATIEAATGGQAIQLARAAAPDAVVLDVHLPDIDGFEVCRRLKGDPATKCTPVLFLSATYTGLEARARGLESGAQGYLTKPYEPAELASAVTNLVKLREAEIAKERYELLFERNLAGVFRATPDGRLIECNDAFSRLLGHGPREAMLGRDVWELSAAEAGERDRLLERLRLERRVANRETRWRRADGAPLILMMNASLIGDGADASIEAIVLDVTERTRAEEALRARETQLRNLGNNLPDGVIYQVVRRPDGSNYFPYMSSSSALEGMFGATAEEAMRDASVAYRLVLPEDLARIRGAADESIRTGEPFDVEYRLRTPAGDLRWFNLRARPSPLPDGGTLWDAVALDVTARKRAEELFRAHEARLRDLAETLRRSEERYRLLFERSFVGIFRIKGDGVVLDCNDAFARILGHPNAAATRGRSVIDHFAPADRDALVARLDGGEEVVHAELTGRRVDGSPLPMALSVRRIVEIDGPIHEGILIDLTDRKRAEESLALRSVTELANAAAHEINNPLTIVLGQIALIEKGRDVADGIERARAAALRIRDIVRHMTRITRLERSKGWSASLPPMLDLRRSSAAGDPPVDASRP